MIKIAVITKENVAKEIIFYLGLLVKSEFSFRYYTSIVDFVKNGKVKDYDIIVMDEAYNNVRISNSLNLRKNSAIIIYTTYERYREINSPYERIFYINADDVGKDLNKISKSLTTSLLKHNEYLFSYNGIVMKLKYYDIYYVVKDDKNLVFHTKKGELYQRGSIAKLSQDFEEYDFIRINSGILVNYSYIFRIEDDEVELIDHTILPISRSRKPRLIEYVRKKTEIAK